RLHVENVADGMAFEAHRESFRVVAAAAADLASDIHVGKGIHPDAALPVALAGVATSPFDIEAEAAWLVAALARFGQHGEELADGSEDAGVGGGIRTGSAADGRLIDFDDFVDVVGAHKLLIGARGFLRAIELLREGAVQDV